MQNRQIFESLNLESDSKVAAIVVNNALPSIIGMPSPSGVDGRSVASRIGGLPDLASEYPRDRSGRPLLFLAQIQFSDFSLSGSAQIMPGFERHEGVPPDDSLGCQSFDIPNSGLLSLFWNERKDASNPKDRHSFRIIWSEANQLSPSNTDATNSICDPIHLSFTNHWSVPANISDWKMSNTANGSAGILPASDTNDGTAGVPPTSNAANGTAGVPFASNAANGTAGVPPTSNNDPNSTISPTQIQKIIDQNTSSISEAICVLFGYGDAEINRKKEIAAFASNGVSWSPARSADSCYSHLVDAACDWIFLMRINAMPKLGFDLGGTKSISLLIHKNDLKENQLDKAWMVY